LELTYDFQLNTPALITGSPENDGQLGHRFLFAQHGYSDQLTIFLVL